MEQTLVVRGSVARIWNANEQLKGVEINWQSIVLGNDGSGLQN